MKTELNHCLLCPRQCGRNRNESAGFCGATAEMKVARAALHHWEEPCISGTDESRGSGTIFFSGCPLKCIFCQNYHISNEAFGYHVTTDRLAEMMLELQNIGAYNINLVTPTPYVLHILEARKKLGDMLKIPVLYNTGGYETIRTLEMLDGTVQVYLPDLKYYSSDLSLRYSKVSNYFEVTTRAIEKMISMVGPVQFDEAGLIQKGVIIRHLILPGHYKDSIKVLHWIAGHCNLQNIRVSIMSQFTPIPECREKELQRGLFSFEVHKVMDEAERLGIEGYYQDRSACDAKFTPSFDGTGVIKEE